MASAAKLVKTAPVIEPKLKAFIDEVLVPALVRGTLSDLAAEKVLASDSRTVADSTSTALHSAEEMA